MKLMTLTELREAFPAVRDIPERTLRHWASKCWIPAYKQDETWYVDLDELERRWKGYKLI